MKRIFPALSLLLAFVSLTVAQKTENKIITSARNETSASRGGRQIDLQSGTQLTGELQNTLDARYAKVGDRVIVKTTQAVKENDQVIVPKGAKLLGHVTHVQQRTKSNGESRLGIVFDHLQNGSLITPITASIVSITQVRSTARAADSGMDSEVMSSSSARSTSSAGTNSGLLGGATNTVGGVVNTTTSAVGSVAGNTTNPVGTTVSSPPSTVANPTGALRGLRITESSNTSAEGGSTLSLGSGNLRLESGTQFTLAVSNSANAGNP